MDLPDFRRLGYYLDPKELPIKRLDVTHSTRLGSNPSFSWNFEGPGKRPSIGASGGPKGRFLFGSQLGLRRVSPVFRTVSRRNTEHKRTFLGYWPTPRCFLVRNLGPVLARGKRRAGLLGPKKSPFGSSKEDQAPPSPATPPPMAGNWSVR